MSTSSNSKKDENDSFKDMIEVLKMKQQQNGEPFYIWEKNKGLQEEKKKNSGEEPKK